MASLYQRRGIPTIINAAGTLTRLSGGVMRPEVAAAMIEASAAAVDMAELQARASLVIAGITGAEAGLVTSGASAGLLLATAACLAGLDVAAMNRLPDTTGLKNEVIVPCGHRNGYDHAVRAAGAVLVEVGLAEAGSGAGTRDAEAHEIAAAITERTAAILYVAHEGARPSLPEVVAVAHAAGVPVIVDAAAELPPQANLTRFTGEGADLVAFSGGKAIGGPQASGILCGRRDLIMSAALQILDMDVDFVQWSPPRDFIDKAKLKGLPRQGIGRSAKVGKEEIIGLLTALELFVAEGDAARRERWLADLDILQRDLAGDARASVVRLDGEVPKLGLKVDDAGTLVLALLRGSPPIHVDQSRIRNGIVLFNPIALRPGDAGRIAQAVVRLLA